MKEKKDIFNGKIKKEYFSYILGYMIFFIVMFVGIGVLCIYASIWGAASNPLGERVLIAAFGVIAFMFAFIYLFLELLVIRRFPKYEKLRRILFNSDCYFTESNSKEYYGRHRRRDMAVFELVTRFAESEKGMGNKKPIQYKIYLALVILMSVLGLVILIVTPLLFENGAILPKMSQEVFVFGYISGGIICIAFAIFFLLRAYKVALMAPFENEKWRYALYTSLVDISARRNNKKHKFWYETARLNEIENLVHSATENAELKFERKGDKLVSFEVIDTLNNRVFFTGLFI